MKAPPMGHYPIQPLPLSCNPVTADSPHLVGGQVDRFQYHLSQAESALATDDLTEAVRHFKEACELADGGQDYMVIKAQSYVQKGRWDQALTTFTQAMRQLCDAGKLKEAQALITDVTNQLPQYFSPLCSTTGRDGIASENRDFHSDTIQDMCELMGLLEREKNENLLLQYLRLFTRIDSGNTDLRMLLGPRLAKAGHKKEAVHQLVTAAKQLMQRREVDSAEQILAEAAEIMPGHPDVKATFFRGLIIRGDIEMGLSGLKKLHDQHPNNMETVKTMANCLLACNRLTEARDWFFQVFRLNSNSTQALEDLAYRLSRQGAWEEARQTLITTAHHFQRMGDNERAKDLLLLVESHYRPTLH